MDNWTSKIIRKTIGIWNIIIIPKGTTIYSGYDLFTINNFKKNYNYYSTFPVACHYAFNNIHKDNPVSNPDYRAVYSYVLNDDLILLDMENQHNYEILKKMAKYPSYQMISFAFDNGKRRFSLKDIDNEINKWLCQKISRKTKKNVQLDGYAYTENIGNHNEIMICKSTKIDMSKYENIYRYIRADKEHIYNVNKKGNILNRIEISKIHFKINDKLIRLEIRADPTLIPYGYDLDKTIKVKKIPDNFIKNVNIKRIMDNYVMIQFLKDKYILKELYPKTHAYYSKIIKIEMEKIKKDSVSPKKDSVSPMKDSVSPMKDTKKGKVKKHKDVHKFVLSYNKATGMYERKYI